MTIFSQVDPNCPALLSQCIALVFASVAVVLSVVAYVRARDSQNHPAQRKRAGRYAKRPARKK